jgi:hypothetical protein
MIGMRILPHPRYTPDGIVYARFAARDAGYSERDATLAARAFYERDSEMMANPRYRALIELDPSIAFARSSVFENRVLYPWIVARFLPIAGFRALFLVSAGSYLAFAVVLFWLLSAFGRPWIAAMLSIAVLAFPMTQVLASSDLTDMLAAVWWTSALAALLRYVRQERSWLPAVLALASVLLTLTRPTPYLVVAPAIVAALLRRSWPLFAASCTGILTFAFVAATAHGYGIRDQLQWLYVHERGHSTASFSVWYGGALSATVRYVAVQCVRTFVPLAAIVAVVYAARHPRRRDEALILAVAALACLAALPFDPILADVPRVIGFPLLPVFCAILQCGMDAALAEKRSMERPNVPTAAAF